MWPCPLGFSCCLLWRVGSLTADTTHLRSPRNLAKQTYYFASSRLEESPFSLKVCAEVRANLSILHGTVAFFMHASPHFHSGAFRSFCIFLNSFLFCLFYSVPHSKRRFLNRFYSCCLNLRSFELELVKLLDYVGWLVSLFNGISTFVGYLMPKLSF